MSEAVHPNPVIELRNVSKQFGSNRVLIDCSMQVFSGETFAILGGSGSGKSVCLKHMIGLIRPDVGEVYLFGEEISQSNEDDLIDLRRRIGMLFQSAALFDSLSVLENIAYPLREHLKLSEEEIEARVDECLDAVGMKGAASLMPAELSGGMRKRVGLARAIAMRPEVIIYDEPTTGLDPANSRRIGHLIRDLQSRFQVTSIVVTHDLELCFSVSDRIGFLKSGKLVAAGTVSEIRNSTHPTVRAYLEGEQDDGELKEIEEGEDASK